MNFCPKDLCEKLVKMRCKSESLWWWSKNKWEEWDDDPERIAYPDKYKDNVPIFTIEDFVGLSDQAKENAKLVFSAGWNGIEVKIDRCPVCQTPDDEGIYSVTYNRHAMIDADDPWKFLEETMKEER